MQTLQEKKTELVRLMDDFIRDTLMGALQGYWRIHYIATHTKPEETGHAEAARIPIVIFLMNYFNQGVYNMVTNGRDKHFMKKFSQMKETLNHGYRCLLLIVMELARQTLSQINLNYLKFDEKIMDFTNLDSVLSQIFDATRSIKEAVMNHDCHSKDEDITKWNPLEKLFYLNVMKMGLDGKMSN